jgi:hypothetical protein
MSFWTSSRNKLTTLINLKRPSRKAVEFNQRLEIEQIAILVKQYVDLCHLLGAAETTVNDFDFEQMLLDFDDFMEPADFNLLYDHEFGRGYLMGCWYRFSMEREALEGAGVDLDN